MRFKVKITYTNGEECLKYMTKTEIESLIQLDLFDENILELKYQRIREKKEKKE